MPMVRTVHRADLRCAWRRADLPAMVVSGFASHLRWHEPHTAVLAKPVSMGTVEQQLAHLLADAQTVQGLRA